MFMQGIEVDVYAGNKSKVFHQEGLFPPQSEGHLLHSPHLGGRHQELLCAHAPHKDRHCLLMLLHAPKYLS